MRVLWFSNTPANADEFIGHQLKGTGGWLKSLDYMIQEKVDLHVAFYYKDKCESFMYLQTHYHPIFDASFKLINRIKNLFLTRITFNEDLDKYLEIINKVKPDIIHIHGTELPFGYIIGKTKVPVVISIQGNITVYTHKFFSGLEKENLPLNFPMSGLFFSAGIFNKTYKKFKKWAPEEQLILKKCKNIIGRTDWDYRISKVLSPNSKYFYVSEILRNAFYKEPLKIASKDKFVISTTNGNNFYKGFETLCESLYLLNQSHHNNIEWRVAGISQTDAIVKITKKKLGNKYPNKNLIFLGSLDENSLRQNLLESDLYVMTSHIENSPNNLSEAMILGIPCIATFAGGTGTLIDNNVNGLLIQAGDPYVMAGAILDLKSQPSKMADIGRNARSEAMRRHDPRKIVDDLISTYQSVIIKSY
jgi:glycosyltransferase involved in cell wall biosynthesis